ncbi:MAG: hypothetical protein MRY83_24455, partial [Flavobacteriales bacterium]|nr:hypothetical protein [Flavobacteriales bacterium]
MNGFSKYKFNLPPEHKVVKRNRVITAYYAQLYKVNPNLFKWAGMAAFASFHIGEYLKMWDWETSGIRTFEATCKKKNRSIEDDVQIIRIINNRIFQEIGSEHLAFNQLDFESFQSLLKEKKRHSLVLEAFERLDRLRSESQNKLLEGSVYEEVWQSNMQILWHEQSQVVQPLFDKLSMLFSGAMSFVA